MRPMLLRPPRLLWRSSSGAYGAPLCRPGVFTVTTARRPGEVGLAFLTGMTVTASGLFAHEIDGTARRQAHVGFLPVALRASALAETLGLAAHVHDLHILDLDVEEFFHRAAHARLVGITAHAEYHLVVGFAHLRGLFRHMRSEQHARHRFVFELHASHSSSRRMDGTVINKIGRASCRERV